MDFELTITIVINLSCIVLPIVLYAKGPIWIVEEGRALHFSRCNGPVKLAVFGPIL